MVKQFRDNPLLFDHTFVIHFTLAFDEANTYR